MGSFGVDIDAVADTFVKNASKIAATKLTYSPHNKSYPKADSGPVTFVGLYLGRFGADGTGDKKVRDALFAANLDVFSIYEHGFKGGKTVPALTAETKRYFVKGRGKTDGKQAVAWAHLANQPRTAPIYFAVDTNPSLVGKNIYDIEDPATKNVFLTYFHEVKESVGGAYPIGCYGTDFLLRWLVADGLISYLWQTCSTYGCPTTCPTGPGVKFMHQYQGNQPMLGTLFDYNYAPGKDFGLWGLTYETGSGKKQA